MDDYRQPGAMAAIDAILAQTGARQVNAAGYCLGGTLLAIAAAAMARDHDHRLASISLLAAQVDFTEPGELSLFIDDSLASARYLVGGRPVSLSDIDVPVCALGTLTGHVAPWRSVYKIIPLTDTEITFILTSGGHNAGVVSPPDSVRRSYQVAVHGHDSPYVDPDSWQARVPQVNGSWWPAWEGWLARHVGAQVAPPALLANAPAAPGNYVLQA